jgi:hypothetical protein
MYDVPLDLQRRFEQRWAARFAPRVVSTRPKSIVSSGAGQNPRAFSKGKARLVAPAGVKCAPSA